MANQTDKLALTLSSTRDLGTYANGDPAIAVAVGVAVALVLVGSGLGWAASQIYKAPKR